MADGPDNPSRGESIEDERAYWDERATCAALMAWVEDPRGLTLDEVLRGVRPDNVRSQIKTTPLEELRRRPREL